MSTYGLSRDTAYTVAQASKGNGDCVGFIECPCERCRRERVTATGAHPNHERGQAPYCGACRTAQRVSAS